MKSIKQNLLRFSLALLLLAIVFSIPLNLLNIRMPQKRLETAVSSVENMFLGGNAERRGVFIQVKDETGLVASGGSLGTSVSNLEGAAVYFYFVREGGMMEKLEARPNKLGSTAHLEEILQDEKCDYAIQDSWGTVWTVKRRTIPFEEFPGAKKSSAPPC